MLEFDFLRSWTVARKEVDYTDRDVMLYALAVGLGGSDPKELTYVYERDLRIAPTFIMVAGHWLPWLHDPRTGIDVRRLLHGESWLRLDGTLPPAGTLTVESDVTHVIDKGKDKGAVVYFENRVTVSGSDSYVARLGGCFLFPWDGGPGDGNPTAPKPLPKVPEGAPDASFEQWVPENAAQLYRLTGDRNPIHVDHEIARWAGLERPLLHGLCTFGYVTNALLRLHADADGACLQEISARYVSPMYPGQMLRTESFSMGDGQFAFRAVTGQGKAVINNGRVQFKAKQ